MAWATITKERWPGGVVPNVTDYEAARAGFSWADARAALDGLPGGRGLNIAHEAVDRHAAGATAGKVAVRWLRRDGTVEDATYAELAERTDRFASALGALGVRSGDAVFTLLGRVPELWVTALGTLKATAVFAPLYAAYGPEPVRERLVRGEGRVLVTTPTLYRRRVEPIRDRLPALAHVLLVGPPDGEPPAGTRWFDEVVAAAPGGFEIPATDPEAPAIVHFTSGTTGTPKGAVHVHEAVVAHHATGAIALDLHPDDVFWCTADPGWVTGTSYGIVAPLTHGVTVVVDEGDFDADRWCRILAEQRVTVWYTSPTALRMLRRAGPEAIGGHDLSALRLVASVGEPLDPDLVAWGMEVLGHPVHDSWWQTETGGIMIANLAGCEIRPGSMGRPLPGIEVAVLARGDDGRAAAAVDGSVQELGPDEAGELALRPGWPSMFRGYLHDDERYAACFAGGWYLTGDVVRRDVEGWIWFVGRADDVITSAGHLIGPVEVEQTLRQHPAVVDAGVVGVPDEVAGELVKAYVVVRPDLPVTEELVSDVLAFARRRLGPTVAPRSIEVVDDLPHTRSGKIVRRVLRARARGLAEDDRSTPEAPL